jgi:excisionase family DNA binding protein
MQSMTIEPRYLDINGASAYLGRSDRALYNLVWRQAIPFIRRGRRVLFDRKALDRWMQEGRVCLTKSRKR